MSGGVIHTYAFVHGQTCPTCHEDICMDIAIEMGLEGTFAVSTEHKLFCPDCHPDEMPEQTDEDVQWDMLVDEKTLEYRAGQIVDVVAEKLDKELLQRLIYRRKKK